MEDCVLNEERGPINGILISNLFFFFFLSSIYSFHFSPDSFSASYIASSMLISPISLGTLWIPNIMCTERDPK